MTPKFYLYGTYKEGSETLSARQFSFVVDEYRDLVVPSFLIWFFREADGKALLCKIRRTSRPADIGMKLFVYDAVPIRLLSHGLLNSIYPDSLKEIGMSSREQAGDMMLMRDLFSVPDDKSTLVKNVILKNNSNTIDESYFVFEEPSIESEVVVEAVDAFNTAFKIFGLPPHEIPELIEQQILDFDIASLFPDGRKLGITPDGKHFFEHAGRRLYVHKVDRTPIERCLGVDLIYNYLDERRLVFVQYKCQQKQGKYYRSADASHDAEIQRMEAIPGLAECLNLSAHHESDVRLCRCPVFIKLCKREISHAHAVPVGVYFPLCVWKAIQLERAGLSVRDEPHINSPQFQDLVKTGLIGTTETQSIEIQSHLVQNANDSRLKLVFEETGPVA